MYPAAATRAIGTARRFRGATVPPRYTSRMAVVTTSTLTRTLLTTLLGGGLLVLLFLTRPADADLLAALRSTDPAWLLLALAAYAASYLARALRFRLLLHSVRPPLLQLARVVAVHNLFNMLMPARTGELSYVVLAKRRFGVRTAEGAATLVVARLFDVLGIAVFFVAASLVAGAGEDARGADLFTGAVILLALSAALLVGLVSATNVLVSLAERTAGRFGASRRPLGARLLHAARAVRDELQHVQARGTGGRVFLVTEAQWLLTFLTCWSLLKAAGVDFPFPASVLGSTGLSVALILPVNTFGNVGTFEAGWALGYALAGLDHATAVATAVAAHVWIFLFAAVLGLLGWLSLRGAPITPAAEESA